MEGEVLNVLVPVEIGEEYFEARVTASYRHETIKDYGADEDGNRGQDFERIDNIYIEEAEIEPRYREYQSGDVVELINNADNYKDILEIIKECAYSQL